MKKLVALVVIVIMAITALSAGAQDSAVRLIVVNGQSNAGRLGKGVYAADALYYSPQAVGRGAWTQLRSIGGYHGVEIPLILRLQELCPGTEFAVVQVWANATPISKWEPPAGRQFRRLNSTLDAALSRLDRDATVAGFAWLQNERDSRDPLLAAKYEAAVSDLVAAWRVRHGNPDLPFALMAPHTFMNAGGAVIAEGLGRIDATDDDIAVAQTVDLPTNDDGVHFSSAGLFTLGGRMAEDLYAMGACD